MGADERPGGPSGSVPRRQRCTKRRLSFTEDGDDAHMAEEAAFEPPIERHTSGIYNLIDAIGLLGMALRASNIDSTSHRETPVCFEHHTTAQATTMACAQPL